MDTKKIERGNSNIIDFHADAKEMLNSSRQSKENGNKIANVSKTEVIRGLAQPSRKIDFLNDQLGDTKNELSRSRQNHNALVDQIIFVQKDFKRRLKVATNERRVAEEKYNKISSEFYLKEREADANAKKVVELKEKFNKIHSAYTDKIEKFKEQHKTRIEGRETLSEKKMKILLIEKDKMQKSVNYLMDAVYKRSEKITGYEADIKNLNEEKYDLIQLNESLSEFKEENISTVASLNGELKVLKEEFEAALFELKNNEKSLDQTTFKLKSTTEELETTTLTAKEAQHNFFKMQNEVEVKRAKITDYEQTISELRIKEKESVRLADEVKALQIHEASLEGEVHALKAKEEQYKQQICNKDKSLDEYKGKLDNLEYSFKSLQKEFDESRRRFNEELSAHEAGVFELKSLKKIQDQDILGFKRNIAGLKAERDDKVSEIQALGAKLDKLDRLNERYSHECVSLEEHIAAVTDELKYTKELGNESSANIKDLNEKVFSLSNELLDAKEAKENLELQVTDLCNRAEAEQSKYLLLESELQEKERVISEAKDKEAEFLEAKLEWEDDKEVLEFRIKDFTKSVEEKDREILLKQDKIEEYLKKFRDLNGELDRAKKEVSIFETEKLSLVKGTESLVSKNEELTYKKSQLETFIKDGDAKITKLNNQINEMENKFFAKDQMIASLEKKLSEAGELHASEKRILRDENEKLSKRQEDSTFLQKDREVEMANTQNVLKELKKELSQAKENVLLYRRQIEELENSYSEKEFSFDEYQAIKKKLEDMSSEYNSSEGSLSKRREELSLYSRWVDSQKESLKNHIVRFTQELKLSVSINPLNSYLAMTDKELSKVEFLLARPGIMGEQRNHLEGHHKILVEQKKYISEMVTKTKSDVEKRISEVTGLLKQGDFIPVPPLPPQKKT